MNKPVKVLIVEDSEDDAKLVLRALRHGGFEPTYRRVQTALDLKGALEQERWDAVISDFQMPGFTGMDALNIFRSTGLDNPFILVSGTIGEAIAVEAMKAGASDYLMKASLVRLAPALERELKETQTRAAHRQAQHDLNESEQRFRQIAENIRDVFFLVDAENNRRLYVSPAYEEIWGRSRESLYANPQSWTEAIHPDDRASTYEKFKKEIAEGKFEYEYRIVRPDGSIRWIESRGFAVRDDDGKVVRIAGVARDNTERKQAENRIRHLNRVYAVLSGINMLIVRVRDRDELFREACRIAVENGGFRMAWIGVVDRSVMRIVPLARSGGDEELWGNIKAHSLSRDIGPQGDSWAAQAIREKRAVVANDSQSDAKFAFGRKHAELGIHSLAILPLLVADEAVGVLTLHAGESEFFHEDEMALLKELAADIALALEHINRQQKIDKLSRIRAVSSEINAAIVRIREREALLGEVCRISSEQGKFEMVWIGSIDHQARQIRPIAWKGFSEGTARAVDWESTSASRGALGAAMRTGKHSVRNDLKAERPGGKLRQEALDHDCRSMVCLAMSVDTRVEALVVLFADEAGFFDKDEIALLNGVASDISFALQVIEKQKKLDYLSFYDALTGLANRSLFLERVAQHIRSAASGGHKLALFLIDIERFKNINDSLGQPSGDSLLRQAADWLTRNAGDANLLSRLDADHFAAVMPVVNREGDVARAIEKSVEALTNHPFRLKDAVLRIAVKIGVAIFPDDGADADILFKNAEAALKKAKTGGDRYLFYTQKMTEAVAGKLTLENQLRLALDNEEFVLHYQPKISLTSGKLTGAEALIRWNDPRTGLVPPGRFIPILEETGLIYDVGRWALRKALGDYLRWRAAGLPVVRIAVNVSPLQLRNTGFINEIGEAISIDAHAAAGLELEITESLIMEDVKHSIASLQAIRAVGVSIAIDDFGTGFSSLSYLAKLPVDTLKIDRSFVVDMTLAPEGLALVSTIINLAHSLKLKVVAEGVETEEQSRLLRLLNCDEMQGFLFSKPVPVETFENMFLVPPSPA